jgi:hypothetical protein
MGKTLIQILAFIIILFTGCRDRTAKNTPFEKKYEANDSFLGSTIAMDQEVDTVSYPCNNEGYEKASLNLSNPLPSTLDNLSKGKLIFTGHCAHCHGKTGKADAPMIVKDKFPPPPPYRVRLKTIDDGKMFQSLTCGKNLMPSFKNELTVNERWKVIFYIKTLKDK